MPDPLSTDTAADDVLAPSGRVRLAMADQPPEVPPSGKFPAGKTAPSRELFPMAESAPGSFGGAPAPMAPRGAAKEAVFKPPSPNVAKAIRRITLYIKDGWGTGGDRTMEPSPVLMRNLAIMQRGGPMAEKIADHMLNTFREHPQEAPPKLEPPTIDIKPSK